MTLEEAIQSNEQSELSYRYRMHHLPSKEAKKLCLQIATNYHQQAEWLKELAERRKQPEIIYCKDCENWDTTWQNDSAPNYHYCPMIDGTYSGDFYCAKAERRTDDKR